MAAKKQRAKVSNAALARQVARKLRVAYVLVDKRTRRFHDFYLTRAAARVFKKDHETIVPLRLTVQATGPTS